jgi:hypothetical protein
MNPWTLFSTGTAYFLLVSSGITFACDPDAVKGNIDWLKTNNPGIYSDISGGCRALNGTMETGQALQTIIDGYKTGQAHNPDAAAAIDGCTAVQVLQLCGLAGH